MKLKLDASQSNMAKGWFKIVTMTLPTKTQF